MRADLEDDGKGKVDKKGRLRGEGDEECWKAKINRGNNNKKQRAKKKKIPRRHVYYSIQTKNALFVSKKKNTHTLHKDTETLSRF